MRVLDLCSGTGSATQAFKDRGHEVETLDIIGNHTYVMDVRDFVISKKYDFIHASPPCTCFSVGSIGTHWKNGVPDKDALESMEILRACLDICKTSLYTLENPDAMIKRVPFMLNEPHTILTYCQYGDTAQKRTILYNNIGFVGKRCKNGDTCHVSAPRGSKTPGSTQGKKDINERYKVPYGLSLAICKTIEATL